MIRFIISFALLAPTVALQMERGSPKELEKTPIEPGSFNSENLKEHDAQHPITIPFALAAKFPANTPQEMIGNSFNEALTTFHLGKVREKVTLDAFYSRWFIYGGGGVITASLLWAIVAYAYTRVKEDPRRLKEGSPEDANGEFKYGLFDCGSSPQMTAVSFCCLPVRWADTMRLAGFLSFWPALCLIILVGPVLSILGFGAVAIVVMMTYYRVELRRAFSMPVGVKSTVLDCLSVAFCMCCSVVQEARHVEMAHEVGHPIFNDKIPFRDAV